MVKQKIVCCMILAFLVLSFFVVYREGLSMGDMNKAPPNTDEEEAQIKEASAAPTRAPNSMECTKYEEIIHNYRKDLAKGQYMDWHYCKSEDNQSCTQIPNPTNPNLPCPVGYREANINDIPQPTEKAGIF